MQKKEFRIYLRLLKKEDADISIHWRRNDEIWKTMIGPKYFVSAANEKKWVETWMVREDEQMVRAICLKEDDTLVGFVYLSQIDRENRSGASGKLIGLQEAWSLGYGAEATLLMLHHAFMQMGLERIESRQMIWHHAARRSVEKLGYQKDGVLRRAVYKDGVFEDMTVMSILKEEFLPQLELYHWPDEAQPTEEEGLR